MKILLLFLICFLGDKDFEIREAAHACISNIGEYFNIEDEIIDFYKESKDLEVKYRLVNIYNNLPIGDYPDIKESIRLVRATVYIDENLAVFLEEKYMSQAKGNKFKAGELFIKDRYKIYQDELDFVKRQYPNMEPQSYPATFLTTKLQEYKSAVRQNRYERIK